MVRHHSPGLPFTEKWNNTNFSLLLTSGIHCSEELMEVIQGERCWPASLVILCCTATVSALPVLLRPKTPFIHPTLKTTIRMLLNPKEQSRWSAGPGAAMNTQLRGFLHTHCCPQHWAKLGLTWGSCCLPCCPACMHRMCCEEVPPKRSAIPRLPNGHADVRLSYFLTIRKSAATVRVNGCTCCWHFVLLSRYFVWVTAYASQAQPGFTG